ncbi:hypothetical protein [Achromobacter piechaudii]|uniref:hypothetical protein n=1 Tax=Achromobacter piechaudii TaxID=72556 RepID=UPI001E5A32A7|nr:hypothetical protein [Achromobacter piechaudii]
MRDQLMHARAEQRGDGAMDQDGPIRRVQTRCAGAFQGQIIHGGDSSNPPAIARARVDETIIKSSPAPIFRSKLGTRYIAAERGESTLKRRLSADCAVAGICNNF